MEFEMQGIDELIRELETFGRDVKKTKDEALQKGGEFFQQKVKEGIAQAGIKRRTGNLESHIELSDIENNEITVFIDQQGKAYYVDMLEEGTSKMRARPFMYPAYHRYSNQSELTMTNVVTMRIRL